MATKKNKSVSKDSGPLFGKMIGTIQLVGDILSPIDEAWNVDQDDLRKTFPSPKKPRG
jgi:hypothetical protein